MSFSGTPIDAARVLNFSRSSSRCEPPIISPIYGIVSDTDQEVREQKQEIRLTSAISHEKMDLDEIRKKAFGDLTDDLKDNINYGRTTTVVKEEK